MDLYVEPENFETIKLLVSELVTNSVRHGQPDRTKGIDLRVTSTHEHVHVEVIDHGVGFEPPRPAVEPGSSATGGWGLFLTDRLAFDWGVESDGSTCVWFDVPLIGERGGGHSSVHQGRADRAPAGSGIAQRRPRRRSTAR
jgi:LytS/YehU family sensor histidine kinase